MSSESMSKRLGPLEGVRVIDFSIMMAGPYCTRFLADMGAEVIKVETPDGDHIRNLEPLRTGRSAYFGHMNCGKRSVVLDLKKPAAVEAAKGLVSKADIVVENFRPGVAERLGVDYETLAGADARLIYCSISGFGQTGPAADRPAYAQVVQASSGYDIALMKYQELPGSSAQQQHFSGGCTRQHICDIGVVGRASPAGAIGEGPIYRSCADGQYHDDLSL